MEIVVLENRLPIQRRERINQGQYLIDLFLSSLNTENTKEQYRKSIESFFDYLYPNEELTAQMMVVDPIDAEEYISIYKDKLNKKEIKASTYNQKISGVKQFYDWLMGKTVSNIYNRQIFKINPFVTVKQVSQNDKEGSSPLTPDEILLMLNNPSGESEHIKERNRLIFELGITTGIRCTALVTTKISDIKLIGTDWVLKVLDKENKWTNKPVNLFYTRLVTWYEKDKKIRSKDNGTIFNLHPVSANRIIREWANDLGLNKNITFHSLRTTTAVQIFHNAGNNLYEAQMFLNHSHSSTTKQYVDKENIINHAGENIIANIKNECEFDDYINTLSHEQLISQLKSINREIKSTIMREWRK